jgi:LPXTG-site transpeptidase (sortase) family protein
VAAADGGLLQPGRDGLAAAAGTGQPASGSRDASAADIVPTRTYEAVQIIFPTPAVVETLPNFPIPTPQLTNTPGQSEEPPDTSPVERILIPALGVDTVVKYVPFDGVTWLIAGLQQEVAWLGETSWPGLGGNTALAGHVTLRNGGNGPFRYLEDMLPGDLITLMTEKNIYSYQVSEQRVVGETELSVVEPSQEDRLTLITCTGWDTNLGFYVDRFVVSADLISVEPRVEEIRGN